MANRLDIHCAGEYFKEIRPICYICKKQVEDIIYFQDFYSLEVYFQVKCHGDEEIRTVPLHFFQENGFTSLGIGVAFNIRKIENGKEMDKKSY